MNQVKEVVPQPQKPYLTLSIKEGGARNLIQSLKTFLVSYSHPTKQKTFHSQLYNPKSCQGVIFLNKKTD